MLCINARTENHLELAAVHAAWLMNCWIEKDHRITANDLLGRAKTTVSVSDFASVEDFQEYLREQGKE